MGHEIRRMAAKKKEDFSVKKKLKSKKTVIMQNMSEEIVT